MPIAGGMPFLIGLTVFIAASIGISSLQGRISFSQRFLAPFTFAILLFAWELAGLTLHQDRQDFLYLGSRALWILIGLCYILHFSSRPSEKVVDELSRILLVSLTLLIVLMILEASFWPVRETGRQLGSLNIPIPRATGVPQSDGKIGVFMCVALAYFGTLCAYRPSKLVFIGALLAMIPLLFTQSRSSLLALVFVGGAVSMLYLIHRKDSISFILLMVLSLIAVAFLYFGVDNIYTMLKGEGVYARNIDARSDGANYGWDLINRNEWFGQGGKYIRVEDRNMAVHNTFILMSIKSGLVAGFLLMMFFISSAVSYWQPVILKRSLVIIAIFSAGAVEHMLYPGVFNEHLWLMVVCAFALSTLHKTSTSTS